MLPIKERIADKEKYSENLQNLKNANINKFLAHSLALRGLFSKSQVLFDYEFLSFKELYNIQKASEIIANYILNNKKIIVVADYDCDGATACAVAVDGLRYLGADIDFVVPNRFIHGYGLTPSVVNFALNKNPKLIITVDNGIASFEGVELANSLGIDVIITDHHLPNASNTLPQAKTIINPNQGLCNFKSKNLSGVGVMFYVLAGVKAYFNFLKIKPPENFDLSSYIDLVALGTVADVVRLDDNNRLIVNEGLKRIKNGLARPGIKALFDVSGRNIYNASSQDFGFSIGPRINAAGRLDDMSIGIKCLLSKTYEEALEYAKILNDFNKKRKDIQFEMSELILNNITQDPLKFTNVFYNENFHEGVVGIVAGKIKDLTYAPSVVFSKTTEQDILKGSARSIPELHLRDALDLVYKRRPDILNKFGGHAMAAGLSININSLKEFEEEFEKAVKDILNNKRYGKIIEIDGELEESEITFELGLSLKNQVWGQGFEEPLWIGNFNVLDAKIIGKEQNHLRMGIEINGKLVEAIQFFNTEVPKNNYIDLVYKIDINEFKNTRKLQLNILDKSN